MDGISDIRTPFNFLTKCQYRKIILSQLFLKRQINLQNHVDQNQHPPPLPGPPPACQRSSTQSAARRTRDRKRFLSDAVNMLNGTEPR